MNKALKELLVHLLNRNYVGGKHTPEDKVLKFKARNMNREETREFYREYRLLLNQELLLKIKKRTGKGSDWHISLNPRKLCEVHELMRLDNEDENIDA